MTAKNLSPMEGIERRIYLIRGHKVMLDRDLAELYGVKAIALRQQVKRNKERFPADFMFRLSQKETALLLSQNVIPSRRSLGGFSPYVFTQEGVAMISGVLKSPRAIQVNIAIILETAVAPSSKRGFCLICFGKSGFGILTQWVKPKDVSKPRYCA